MTNTHRQEANPGGHGGCAVMSPPSSGPAMLATANTAPK